MEGDNMYSAHVTEVAKKKKLNDLEFCNWKEQVKTEDTVFVEPDFTFPYYKEEITTWPGTTNVSIAIK